MKKTKKILIGILSVIFALSTLCAVACTGSEKTNAVPQKVKYNVGTSIDLFDLFEIKDGYTYTFKVGEKGEEPSPVMGRYYYAEKSGEYTAHLEGNNGKTILTGTSDFTISDTLPYMMVSSSTIKMNYNSYIDVDRLINTVGIFTSSDSEVSYWVDKVVFYKNHYVTEGEEISITKGTPSGDGLYDGATKLTFKKEGVYEFHLTATNAGGTVDANFTVVVEENVSGYHVLGQPNYDETTRIASWDAVSGASFYRVKIDYENVITDKTSIDIDEYLVPEANGFQDFDLVIIPLDENKKELKFKDGVYDVNGMYIKEDVIIAPEQFGRIVLGQSTKVDPETGIATLIGSAANIDLSTNGLMAMDSGYLGWQGNYGLNTFVDFEFTGNNIPNVIFFADEINNELTYGGKTEDSEKNKGLMVISGIYGAYSPGANIVACSDTVAVFGPNRYDNGWSMTDGRWCAKSGVPAPVYVGGGYKNPIPEEYALLTQDGLRADTTGRTYRYVIGTYGVTSGSTTAIYLEMRLYDVANPDKPLFVVQQDTKLTTDKFIFDGNEFKGGNIVVIAPSKEESVISQIKVSAPYIGKPYNITEKNMTENEDGSYTLKGAYAANANSGTFRSDYENLGSVTGFKAYTGANEEGYGLGTYLDISFKGNNMPILTFFADETSGAIAEGVLPGKTGAGMLILNGLVNKNSDSPAYTDQLRIYGPYKYGVKNDNDEYIYNRENKDYFVSSKKESKLLALQALAQDNLDENIEYRLIIGAIEKNGYICFDIQLVNVTANELIVDKRATTHVSVDAMKDALGLSSSDELKGFIVASGAFKGVDGQGVALDTTCTITLSENERPSSGLTLERYPQTVTLNGAYPPNSNSGSLTESNAGMGTVTGHTTLLDNDDEFEKFGLGTYLDLTFKGNNLPIITFFAGEDSGAIANGCETKYTGAGLIMVNGVVNKGASSPSRADQLSIIGPYKYGAKDDNNAYIYNQGSWGNYRISSNDTGLSMFKSMAQDNLDANTDYRLIVGAVEKDGYIALDVQFADLTNGKQLAEMVVKTKVTVESMKTALGLGAEDELKGYIILNGAFKGAEGTTAKGTEFVLQSVGETRLTTGFVYSPYPETISLKGAYPNNKNTGTLCVAGQFTGHKTLTSADGTLLEYGLNTYLDLTFKGNNLPMITFFAKEDEGSISNGATGATPTGAGLLLWNGIIHKNNSNTLTKYRTDMFTITGPYRYGAKNSAGSAYIYNQDTFQNYSVASNMTGYSSLSKLAQDNLDANTDYRLIVGTVEKDGDIYLDIQFVNVTANRLLIEMLAKTKVTVEGMKTALGLGTTDELKGYIILNGAFKGAEGTMANGTEFILNSVGETRPTTGLVYSRYPEEITLKGATITNNANTSNFNGSVASWINGHTALTDDNNEIKKYGLNTYVDISFVGNNMPIMTFFASKDSGGIADGKGLLIINGLVNSTGTNQRTNYVHIHGVDKYKSGSQKVSSSAATVFQPLTQDNLSLNADTEYRLIIGVIEKSGNIYFDVQVKNVKSGIILGAAEVDTKVTVADMKTALGITTGDLEGYIILNGAYKGFDANNNNAPLSTTFTINAVSAGKITMPTETVA